MSMFCLLIVLFAASASTLSPQRTSAACPTLASDKGQVSTNVTISQAGVYHIWSRIKAPDNSNNSYKLQVGDVLCGAVVGDGSAIPANTWTWVKYQNGNTSSIVSLTLNAGSYPVLLAGHESGVQVDRVIITADTQCVPTGTGDNCAAGSSAPSNTADLNSDGTVNIYDLSILLSKWVSADATSDINDDGRVDVFDLSILLSKWGQ